MHTIINLHDYASKADVTRDIGPDWVYVGPATQALGGLKGSALATPLARREPDAMARYRQWLWAQVQGHEQGVLEALRDIGPKTVLACWCDPTPCYSQVIARAAAWLRRQASSSSSSEAASPSAERCAEVKAAAADSARRRKPPLPTRSQPTAYLGDTPDRCAWHPEAHLRKYRLPHIGIVHAHRLPNGTWCAVVPQSARAA